jgi:hypothetical protein
MTVNGVAKRFFLLFLFKSLVISLYRRISIFEENQKPGSKDWLYDHDGREQSGPQGFTSKFSYDPGDRIDIKISFNESQLNLKIYRLGYYNGVGARLYHEQSLKAYYSFDQPPCIIDIESNLVDCSNWYNTYSWIIPNTAVSGIYVILPTASKGKQIYYGNYIPFVVRRPWNENVRGEILFKTSDYTWVAYNKYGGWNLYRGNGSYKFDQRAYKVSYNRPFSNRLPKVLGGAHQNFVFGSEYPMLQWLEKHGYDVDYASCFDVESIYLKNPSQLLHYKVLLSVGHDEYWTLQLRQTFEFAREYGIHLGFFSGNEIFWQIRIEYEKNSYLNNREQSEYKKKKVVYREPWNVWGHSLASFKSYDITYTNLSINIEPRIIVCYKETINKGMLRIQHPSMREESLNEMKSYLLQFHSQIILGNRSNIYKIRTDDSPFEKVKRGEHNFYLKSLNGSHLDWTGTFIDPRFRIAIPQHALSGQYFQVNGYRNDAMTIPKEYNSLRLWRNTTFYGSNTTYTTFDGLLGYEMDVWNDDCYHPDGLVGFSHTNLQISNHLMEDYGASYKGNGDVIHKVILYRYTTNTHQAPKSQLVKNLRFKKVYNYTKREKSLIKYQGSSIVFGAGTIQWSWALSTQHDGSEPKTTDRDIQQATMNILADMNVKPQQITHDESISPPLIFPDTSTDIYPPISYITRPHHMQLIKLHYKPNSFIVISGFARDSWDGVNTNSRGRVALVEVSLDDGYTWHTAEGRDKWVFRYYLFRSTKYCGPKRLTVSNNSSLEELQSSFSDVAWRESLKDGVIQNASKYFIHILSRATDDSGWTETVPYNKHYESSYLSSGVHSKRCRRNLDRDIPTVNDYYFNCRVFSLDIELK